MNKSFALLTVVALTLLAIACAPAAKQEEVVDSTTVSIDTLTTDTVVVK